MRIQSVRMQAFKRFTDLTVTGIPESAKLVVVVGPNGCGKSSLFEAFLEWRRSEVQIRYINDDQYFLKDPTTSIDGPATTNRKAINLQAYGRVPERYALYVRTAYRNDPDFSHDDLARPSDPQVSTLSRRIIDDDRAVSDNYRRLIYLTASGVYNKDNDEKRVRELREELIGAVRISMQNVFEDLLLHNITDPFESEPTSGSFYFEKGNATSYHYKNLSGGEKAAFDILLDLHLKKKLFTDAVYCIDEIEAHLHTAVQGALVQEIVKIVPDSGQLWLTTHSLGVLRAAQRIESTDPGSTCIIDFEGVDLDKQATLFPVTIDRVAWGKLLDITLDDVAGLVAPSFIVICEGSSIGKRRKNFDADIYATILAKHEPGVAFVPGGSSTQVQHSGTDLRGMLKAILPQTKVFTLLDRDERSDEEVSTLDENTLVLSERNIESYLLSEEVIEMLVEKQGRTEFLADALDIRRRALDENTARGKMSDDLKSAAGTIYVGLKQLLDLKQSGNNADAFMRDTLAPLIGQESATYKKLRADTIEKLR